MARQSAAGTLRAAGYRSIEKGMLQLGASATPYLATPALPALLAEVRAVIAAASPADTSAAKDTTTTAADGTAITGAAGRASGATVSAAGKGGMRVEPAMSARKSSQKKQRRSREKEVGRALAAADAAAAAALAASGNSSAVGGSGGVGGGGRRGAVWSGAASEAEREAACAGLSCLTQLVLCCKGHLPLGGRVAVDDVVHQGLGALARANVRGRTAVGVSAGSGGVCSPLEDPAVAREFVGLAHACLVTPLVSECTGRCFVFSRLDAGGLAGVAACPCVVLFWSCLGVSHGDGDPQV